METVSFMSSGSSDNKIQTEGGAVDEFWARERAWQVSELEKPFSITVSAVVERLLIWERCKMWHWQRCVCALR